MFARRTSYFTWVPSHYIYSLWSSRLFLARWTRYFLHFILTLPDIPWLFDLTVRILPHTVRFLPYVTCSLYLPLRRLYLALHTFFSSIFYLMFSHTNVLILFFLALGTFYHTGHIQTHYPRLHKRIQLYPTCICTATHCYTLSFSYVFSECFPILPHTFR